jgi:hypothetical protein
MSSQAQPYVTSELYEKSVECNITLTEQLSLRQQSPVLSGMAHLRDIIYGEQIVEIASSASWPPDGEQDRRSE